MSGVRMGMGTVREVKPKGKFDIVLANINKNVLLEEMEVYATLVKTNGYLLLSGFYERDILDVAERAFQFGFVEKEVQTKDDWAALILEKL